MLKVNFKKKLSVLLIAASMGIAISAHAVVEHADVLKHRQELQRVAQLMLDEKPISRSDLALIEKGLQNRDLPYQLSSMGLSAREFENRLHRYGLTQKVHLWSNYLEKANSYDIAGVQRYRGTQLTVFSEGLREHMMNSPISDANMRTNVVSCLYNGSAPSKSSPQATNTMQHLELPRMVTAERFVPASSPEDSFVIEEYYISKVAMDWGTVNASTAPAYFYGYLRPAAEFFEGPNGRIAVEPPHPSPEWHQFTCNPRSITFDEMPTINEHQPATSENDDSFVSLRLGMMRNGEAIPRSELERLETILMEGKAPLAIQRNGGQGNVAELVSRYGLERLGAILQRRHEGNLGSNSAADRLARVTSEPSDSDYREEYLEKANSYDIAGVSRYEGAQLTVFSEGLSNYMLNNPISGANMRTNVVSCLYNGSAPSKSSPQATNTMQHLELPRMITAERFVPASSPEDSPVIEEYNISKVAMDWGSVSASTAQAYFYGSIRPATEFYEGPNGRIAVEPPPPPPEWHQFSCNPRSITFDEMPTINEHQPATSENDDSFVSLRLGMMRNGEAIPRSELERLETILMEGKAPQAIRRNGGPGSAAELVSRYGLERLGAILQRRDEGNRNDSTQPSNPRPTPTNPAPQAPQASAPLEPQVCHGADFPALRMAARNDREAMFRAQTWTNGATHTSPDTYRNSGDCTTKGTTFQCQGTQWVRIGGGGTWCGGGGG